MQKSSCEYLSSDRFNQVFSINTQPGLALSVAWSSPHRDHQLGLGLFCRLDWCFLHLRSQLLLARMFGFSSQLCFWLPLPLLGMSANPLVGLYPASFPKTFGEESQWNSVLPCVRSGKLVIPTYLCFDGSSIDIRGGTKFRFSYKFTIVDSLGKGLQMGVSSLLLFIRWNDTYVKISRV